LDNPNEEKYSKLKYSGLNLDEGGVRNSLESGILEPLMSKTK
jgi:chaperonin GroEL (HSP60 family)